MENAQARVYSRKRSEHDDYSTYGCLKRTGRRTFLGDSQANQHVTSGPSTFRLRRALVGFSYYFCGNSQCQVSAETDDLRTGKTIRALPLSDVSQSTEIMKLVMATSGSLGVMEYSEPYQGSGAPLTYTVLKATAKGSTTLDSGTDIDQHSLAIGGGWLYWTRAGAPFSSPIP